MFTFQNQMLKKMKILIQIFKNIFLWKYLDVKKVATKISTFNAQTYMWWYLSRPMSYLG